MSKQNFEIKNDRIREQFDALPAERRERRLNLAWSNWGFGVEPLEASAARLARAGMEFIELHGNHYGPDLGYDPDGTLRLLGDHGLRVAGICGMFSADNDLASNRPIHQQAAVDYIKREVPFAQAVGAGYMLVVPGAVGRPHALRRHGVPPLGADPQAGRRPVRPARRPRRRRAHPLRRGQPRPHYRRRPGVPRRRRPPPACSTSTATSTTCSPRRATSARRSSPPANRLTNLHMADSNRCAQGLGSLDIDTIIRALYVIGYNTDGRYVTFEPLGPGGDPYPAMYGNPDPEALEGLVQQSVRYWREREEAVVGG